MLLSDMTGKHYVLKTEACLSRGTWERDIRIQKKIAESVSNGIQWNFEVNI